MVGNLIKQMIFYFDGDMAQINHTLKVYGYAKLIAEEEGLAGNQLLLVELAAILHDIGIPESRRIYHSSAGPYQEITGIVVAKRLLMQVNCPWAVAQRVLFLVGHHHSLKTDGGLPLQILFEADFLVNLEEETIMESAAHVKEKYFKTHTGKTLIQSLFHV